MPVSTVGVSRGGYGRRYAPSLSRPRPASLVFFAMDVLLARVAELEKKMSAEHFKTIMAVSTNVALARFENKEKEAVARVERIITISKTDMNEVIRNNGVASKQQRFDVQFLVEDLEKRVRQQSREAASMQAGLKQMKDLEAKLIEMIGQDHKDSNARIDELETGWKLLEVGQAAIHAKLRAQQHSPPRGRPGHGLIGHGRSSIASGSSDSTPPRREADVPLMPQSQGSFVPTDRAACNVDFSSANERRDAGHPPRRKKKTTKNLPLPVREFPLTDLLSSSPLGRASEPNQASLPADSSCSQVDLILSLLAAPIAPTNTELQATVPINLAGIQLLKEDSSASSRVGRLCTTVSGEIGFKSTNRFGTGVLGQSVGSLGEDISSLSWASSRASQGSRARSLSEQIGHAQDAAYRRSVSRRREAEWQPSVHEAIESAQGIAYARTASRDAYRRRIE